MKLNNYDITIIGAGPVGLFTAFEAGMQRLSCAIVDNLDFTGGQCTALYPEKPIYDIPAYSEITAQDLIKRLEEQSAPFKPQYFLGQEVVNINKDADFWVVKTKKGNLIRSKVIIIAAGGGAFGPNKPPIANLEEYEEKSVFYMVGQKNAFKDKTVVIAGGGDSAVDWAISLSAIAKKVYVVHRRDKFRAAPETVRQLREIAKEGNIELVIPYQLKSLSGKGGYIKSVLVSDLDDNIKELKADVLLPFFGLSMDLGSIKDFGIDIEHKHIKVDSASMSTNLSGVYAVGDICAYQGKLKLILTGFAEAALACHSAYNYINPDKPVHFEYSTTKGIPTTDGK